MYSFENTHAYHMMTKKAEEQAKDKPVLFRPQPHKKNDGEIEMTPIKAGDDAEVNMSSTNNNKSYGRK